MHPQQSSGILLHQAVKMAILHNWASELSYPHPTYFRDALQGKH